MRNAHQIAVKVAWPLDTEIGGANKGYAGRRWMLILRSRGNRQRQSRQNQRRPDAGQRRYEHMGYGQCGQAVSIRQMGAAVGTVRAGFGLLGFGVSRMTLSARVVRLLGRGLRWRLEHAVQTAWLQRRHQRKQHRSNDIQDRHALYITKSGLNGCDKKTIRGRCRCRAVHRLGSLPQSRRLAKLNFGLEGYHNE